MTAWTIRRAMPEDLMVILGLYDEAVVWLNAQGVTGQWGTMPLSQSAGFARRIEAALPQGVVADGDGVEGFVYVTLTAPAYLTDITGDAAYARGLVASRAPGARGVGTALLQWAEGYAAQQGKRFLRLDCWAGNPKLIAYYERHGFTRCGEFAADGWQGVLMEKPLLIGMNPYKERNMMLSDFEYAKMDPHVAPLVKALNALGLRTESSCEGHNQQGKPNHPSVQFNFGRTGPLDALIAAMILDRAAVHLNVRLHLKADKEELHILLPNKDLSAYHDFLEASAEHIANFHEQYRDAVERLQEASSLLLDEVDE